MPDILIRGMELPKGDPVHLTICSNGAAYLHAYENGYGALVRCQCCAVELPEHGDLIDLDAKVDCQYYDDEYEEWSIRTVTVEDVLHGCLEKMPPVIVPASEPTKSG